MLTKANKNIRKTSIMIVLMTIMIYISWSDNIYFNAMYFIIGIATLINTYSSMFYSLIKNKQMDLDMHKYPKWKKFLIALGTILITNSIWIPTLFVVAISSRLVLFYQIVPKSIVINIGNTLLILIPLTINLITFYSLKNSIIEYKDYFKAATSCILLSFPVLLLIDSYWNLNLELLLKDTHSWGMIITAPLFRLLIELHTMEDPIKSHQSHDFSSTTIKPPV